jgi:cytochrome c biogenesis protein CcmG, thiol:disulfide interchange protein DsbE
VAQVFYIRFLDRIEAKMSMWRPRMRSIPSFLVSLLMIVGLWIEAGAQTNKKASSLGKPWLGIGIEQGKKGVLVKGVIPNTPAESAGFKVGDEVLKIDGKAIKDPRQLIFVVQASGIGSVVKVELLRDKQIISKTLQLVVRPDELKLAQDRLVGKPAPSFDLEVIHGREPGQLAKLGGRIAIVEIWATWCGACRATHHRLSEFAEANPSIAVLAISDEEKDTLKAYAARKSPKFTILRDANGKNISDWMAPAIPMISVISKEGKVEFVTVGAGEAFEEAMKMALALSKKEHKTKN